MFSNNLMLLTSIFNIVSQQTAHKAVIVKRTMKDNIAIE